MIGRFSEWIAEDRQGVDGEGGCAFLIWSYEHDAWWKQKGSGYTKDRGEAGIYTEALAMEICWQANQGDRIEEWAVPYYRARHWIPSDLVIEGRDEE